MGMSASQCRLLSLTSRLSDLEYQAQSISNSKIRLSQNSEAAATEYAEALDKKKITVLSGYNASTGSMNYVDASAYNLTTYNAISTMDKQRFLKDSSGRVLVTSAVAGAFDSAHASAQNLHQTWVSQGGQNNPDSFTSWALWDHRDPSDPSVRDSIDQDDPRYEAFKGYYENIWSGLEKFLNELGYTSNPDANPHQEGLVGSGGTGGTGGEIDDVDLEDITAETNEILSDSSRQATVPPAIDINVPPPPVPPPINIDPIATSLNQEYIYDEAAIAYYTNVFNEITENGYVAPGDDNMQSEEWLYAQLQGGNIYLSEWDAKANNGAGDFVMISWTSGDTTLRTEVDDEGVAQAEAKYKVKLAQIESKDKKFDLNLKQIDTEHLAIQTEVDSVKKVIDKNIGRSFKAFDS